MENAADALKMAAAVLIFVLALSISINAFGEARVASRTILDYNDREYDYTYVEQNVDGDGNISTERIVGAETIIPAIYRSYKENFKIRFKAATESDYKTLYNVNVAGSSEPICEIDLASNTPTLGSDTEKENFINELLYGVGVNRDYGFDEGTHNVDWSGWEEGESLYDYINGKKFEEHLGVYYQGEEEGRTTEEPDANKTTKRVITYIEV